MKNTKDNHLSPSSYFAFAKPIWKRGTFSLLNSICLFSCELSYKGKAKITITARNSYRIALNGKFLAFGPARSAHGYARVDEIDLGELQGNETLIIECAAYNTKTFCTLNEPGFLQAEVKNDEGDVLAYTGKDFLARTYSERLRKVNRYSYQRAFSEAYDFTSSKERFEEPEIVEGASLLPRLVSYPRYDLYPSKLVETGVSHYEKKEIEANRWLQDQKFAFFQDNELEVDPYRYGLSLSYERKSIGNCFNEGDFATFALNEARTGFIGFSCLVEEEAEVYIFFDEIDLGFGEKDAIELNLSRIGCLNALVYHLPKGKFNYFSYEPYSGKYFRVVIRKGRISSPSIVLRGYENPDADSFVFVSSDEEISRIVKAARNNFVSNAVDLFTDCPSRERAGWLCDSYFTAKAEKLFTGKNKVEQAFLNNYLRFKSPLPKGMVPMCYPADSYDGAFIPNWALFLVIEIADLKKRGGDIEPYFDMVKGVFDYFSPFENECGLLENLENWVFVEWSKANDKEFLEGVNFPSNMMYAFALKEAGEAYGNPSWSSKGKILSETIHALSFNGEFFVDNAVRKEGELVATSNISEACQYYAFFSGVASKEQDKKLFETLVKDFGAKRDDKTVYPNVFKSNAFIGNFLRLIMLTSSGEKTKLSEECIAYFSKMALLTGSLWEMDWPSGCSLNHGFASFVANLLTDYMIGYKGFEGYEVYFASPCVDIDCHVEIPLGDDKLIYDRKAGKTNIVLPKGFKIIKIDDENQE